MTDEMKATMIREIDRAQRVGKMRGLSIAQRAIQQQLGNSQVGLALVQKIQRLIDAIVEEA
jgi:hypothetical protein